MTSRSLDQLTNRVYSDLSQNYYCALSLRCAVKNLYFKNLILFVCCLVEGTFHNGACFCSSSLNISCLLSEVALMNNIPIFTCYLHKPSHFSAPEWCKCLEGKTHLCRLANSKWKLQSRRTGDSAVQGNLWDTIGLWLSYNNLATKRTTVWSLSRSFIR